MGDNSEESLCMMNNIDSDDCFKLLALYVLPGCADHIKKCLKEEVFYYFSNDYVIDYKTSRIIPRSVNLKPLKTSFFSIYGSTGPVVNISAVVGKNGDGKSSLIELLIRLINNFAIDFFRDLSNTEFLRISGVRAALYYQIGNEVYKLEERSGKGNGSTITLSRISGEIQLVTKEDCQFHLQFFHTIVSNFSHYAYNIYDFQKEWNLSVNNGWNDDEKCWIYRIFNKNDDYQHPITINPYREKGNIDINSEIFLAKQRLLLLMMTDNSNEGIRRVGGKVANKLEVKKVEFSKFQRKTIQDYFIAVKETNLLENELARLEAIRNKGRIDDSDEEFFHTEISPALHQMYRKLCREHRNLIKALGRWVERENLSIFPANSDIHRMIQMLDDIARTCSFKGHEGLKTQIADIKQCFLTKKKSVTNLYSKMNVLQLQWLDVVSQIYSVWIGYLNDKDINSEECLFEPYDELSENKRCLHYLVYKTISIFQTYRQFGYPLIANQSKPLLFGKRAFSSDPSIRKRERLVNDSIATSFNMLLEDLSNGHSHVSLKIRQTLSYYKQLNQLNPYNTVLHNKYHIAKYDFNHFIISGMDLAQLPPPLFISSVLFLDTNDGSEIAFNYLSSGEKQRLFSLGAVIYHLKNVDTISAAFKYRYVNLIFEEIELYYHPEYQRLFISHLLKLINKAEISNIKGINIIFVTHSPFILSDIPLNNVLFLENGMPISKMQENTFGANINGLLKDGFFLPKLPIGEFAFDKIQEMYKKIGTNDFSASERANLIQDIFIIGEPYIRNQLLKLLRPDLNDRSFKDS